MVHVYDPLQRQESAALWLHCVHVGCPLQVLLLQFGAHYDGWSFWADATGLRVAPQSGGMHLWKAATWYASFCLSSLVNYLTHGKVNVSVVVSRCEALRSLWSCCCIGEGRETRLCGQDDQECWVKQNLIFKISFTYFASFYWHVAPRAAFVSYIENEGSAS